VARPTAVCLTLVCAIVSCLAFPQTIKVNVDLVSIFATVKDAEGRFVTDLTQNDFRVYNDDRLQDVEIFERQDVNSSIGILMDSSGSMVDIMPFMKTGVRDFTRRISRPNEFFVASFSTNVELLHNSSQSQKHLEETMETLRSFGTSVMYDALLYGMNRVQYSKQPRKALIMFTDGTDNGSTGNYSGVVRAAQQSGVLLYFVAIGSRILIDANTLDSLAELSGGRALYVKKGEPIFPLLDEIQSELSKQYYIGFYAPRQTGLHHLHVEVPGRNLRVRAKTGYFVE